MRLFTGAQVSYLKKVDSDFEDFTGAEANEDPDPSGWRIGGSETHLWSDYTDSDEGGRSGSIAVTKINPVNATNLYRTLPNPGKSFMIEGYAMWVSNDPGELRQGAIQIDNGVRTDDILSFVNIDKPDTAITLTMVFDNSTCNFGLIGRYENVPATHQSVGSLPTYAHIPSTFFVGFRLEISENGWIFYADSTGSGPWVLVNSGPHTSPSAKLVEDLDIIRFYNSGNTGAGNRYVAFDDIKVYETTINEGIELTNISALSQCSVAENMEGAGSLTVSDPNMANFSTLKGFIRFNGEIWNDAFTRLLGEYKFMRQSFTRHTVTFLAVERGKILDKTPAEYNSILAAGEITAISDPVMTDDSAAFTADLVGKFCTFTDVVGADIEQIFPNSDTTYDKTAGDDADLITGTYTDLAVAAGEMGFQDVSDLTANRSFIEIVWTVPNQATSTLVEMTLDLRFAAGRYYTATNEFPNVRIYNFNTPGYEIADNANHNGIGPIEWSVDYISEITHVIQIIDNIDQYFDGANKCKIRIFGGAPEQTNPKPGYIQAFVGYAPLVNTYSAQFAADAEIYEIDARTATTLTFTGQTPNGDGVDVKDRYKVGDTLDNIMTAVWNAAGITWLSLNFEPTTKVDATDWQSSMVLPILQIYKNRMRARIWQSTGYTINVATSFASTGLTLTEADEVTDSEGRGFIFTPDGTNLISKAKVFGAGVFSSGAQLSGYDSKQGIIVTDGRVSTQEAALDIVLQTLADNLNPFEKFQMTIDLDSGTNYNAVVLMRTINVSWNIGGVEKIAITAGLITNIHYFQANNGHLRATLLIEVI